jgi:hypothetical protein
VVVLITSLSLIQSQGMCNIPLNNTVKCHLSVSAIFPNYL